MTEVGEHLNTLRTAAARRLCDTDLQTWRQQPLAGCSYSFLFLLKLYQQQHYPWRRGKHFYCNYGMLLKMCLIWQYL